MTFVMPISSTFTFPKSIQFKPRTAGEVRDGNINFKLDRTTLMSEKIQYNIKQSLQSSNVSSRHQIPNFQTNTTSKPNEYINKLTLPYFNFSASHSIIPFFYNIFDQHFCCFEKLFSTSA